MLDREFMARLDPADIVYSWGVLHHTGEMWKAVDAAVGKSKPDGLLGIAIDNDVRRIPDGSRMWWHIKRFYNRSPAAVRRAMEWGYVANFALTRLVTLHNPLRAIANFSSESRRGMDFWHDVRGWLGSFPYEFATAGEVFDYLQMTAT